MNYSAAIKTTIYGIYLRYIGEQFSVTSWRLMGIIFVSLGIFLFCVITKTKLPYNVLILFFILFCTDITVILSSRHDWGPTALALFFRLLFISIFLSGELEKSIPIHNSFILGSLVGLSIFEKLSSVVLITPLVFILIISAKRRSISHWLSITMGFIIGLSPLIFVNLYTYTNQNGLLISLKEMSVSRTLSISGFLDHYFQYLSIGNGYLIKKFILGSIENRNIILDFSTIGIFLGFLIVFTFCNYQKSKWYRIAGILIGCYLIIGIALYFLPRSTWIHHWIIGTPFQYAAVAICIPGINQVFSQKRTLLKTSSLFIRFLLLVLIFIQLYGFIKLENSFLKKEASHKWDPSFTKMANFAAQNYEKALFIAADWGIGTQILCLSNGDSDSVKELFWWYGSKNDLKTVLKITEKKIFYVITKKPIGDVKPHITKMILNDLKNEKMWEEISVEDELTNMKALMVKKYINYFQ